MLGSFRIGRKFCPDTQRATILVGISRKHDETVSYEQFFGTVIKVDRQAGVTVLLKGQQSGETFTLLPVLEQIHPASSRHLSSERNRGNRR